MHRPQRLLRLALTAAIAAAVSTTTLATAIAAAALTTTLATAIAAAVAILATTLAATSFPSTMVSTEPRPSGAPCASGTGEEV